MTRQQILNFISTLSDEEAQNWLEMLEVGYNKERQMANESTKRWKENHPEEVNVYTQIRTTRAKVARNPGIAYDFFDGKFSYYEVIKHWSYLDSGHTVCVSCRKRASSKPAGNCTSERHETYYRMHKLRANARYHRRKEERERANDVRTKSA